MGSGKTSERSSSHTFFSRDRDGVTGSLRCACAKSESGAANLFPCIAVGGTPGAHHLNLARVPSHMLRQRYRVAKQTQASSLNSGHPGSCVVTTIGFVTSVRLHV